MKTTKIEWADRVWNPVTGCSPVSEGCKNCYAKKMAARLAGRFGYPADEPFRPGTLHSDKLTEPLNVKKPQRIFVCSMADLFHEAVDIQIIARVFAIIHDCQKSGLKHQFLILTKRPERMREVMQMRELLHTNDDEKTIFPLPNLWLGVSAENQKAADERIPVLLDTPAAVRFVSVEPMLENINLRQYLPKLDWVICGGETGKNARPTYFGWVHNILLQCKYFGFNVPLFFKQWGDGDKTAFIFGKEYKEFPKQKK